MIKVLEIFGEPISNGGQESFVMNVYTHMDKADMEIDFLTPYYCDNEYYKNLVAENGGHIFAYNLPFCPGGLRNSIKAPIRDALLKKKYDVVHIHSGSISVLAIASRIAKKCGVRKIIVHSHCAAERKTLKYRIVKLLTRHTMNSCPTDYCACSQVAGEWKFSNEIVKNKLVILKNGVDLDKFKFDKEKRNILRSKVGFDEDDYVIGHVGRFSYQKNHEYLVEIFARLSKKTDKYKLLLIGTGENYDEINISVKEKGVAEKVYFAGNVNNVNEYMQAMDIFVLPSRFEGLPIVGVEAQAAGLPVVTSTQVSEELKITENVCFLPLDDMSRWVEKIRELELNRRVDNTETIRVSGYDINSTVTQIEKMYRVN